MEGIFHPDGLAMKMMNWLADMCHIQFLWLTYSLRGGLVFGVFPATQAMFSLHRQLIVQKKVATLSQSFKEVYHHEFKTANQMGYIMFGIGALLILYLRSTVILTTDFAAYFIGLAYALIAFFSLVSLHSLVMLSHLNLNHKQVWKQALLVIFLSPVHSLLILLLLFVFLVMARIVPVLVPVVLVAIFSYVVSYIALRAITKINCHVQ